MFFKRNPEERCQARQDVRDPSSVLKPCLREQNKYGCDCSEAPSSDWEQLEGNGEENAFPLPGRLHFNPVNYAFLI